MFSHLSKLSRHNIASLNSQSLLILAILPFTFPLRRFFSTEEINKAI